MEWLTLEYIKQHSRIDDDCEDALLELYGESAEETILSLCNRTMPDIVARFGTSKNPIPAPLRQAALMLVENSYQQRAPITQASLYTVLYSFDMLIKPYIKLAADVTEGTPVVYGTDAKILFSVDMPDGLTLHDVNFTVTIKGAKEEQVVEKVDCIYITDNSYVVLADTKKLGVGNYMLAVAMEIPDTDYDSGIRREIVNINPHISVIL